MQDALGCHRRSQKLWHPCGHKTCGGGRRGCCGDAEGASSSMSSLPLPSSSSPEPESDPEPPAASACKSVTSSKIQAH